MQENNRYVLEFSKVGQIKYISHLDMQRLFKRAFKSSNIPIDYSKGYNPHPRMGFAQPLSLGYTARKEYLEFYTKEEIVPEEALRLLQNAMPMGIDLISLKPLEIKDKSLASIVVGAVYKVELPISFSSREKDIEKLVTDYLSQETIIAKKREKKSKQIVDVNIKDKIHWIRIEKNENDNITLLMELDCGSTSNLSPEQVISSFTCFSELYLPREEIEVERENLIFKNYI